MEYETPIDQIRPVSTSNKQLDPSSVMDYTEILKGIKPQVSPQAAQENVNMENDQHTIYAQTQQQQQQHHNQPQVQFIQQPAYQQQPQNIPQIQYQQYQNHEEEKPIKKTVGNVNETLNINEIENKDYIFIIVAISIVFSDGMQGNISKVIPNLYKDGKTSMIGLMFNGLLIAIALFLSRKVKVNI